MDNNIIYRNLRIRYPQFIYRAFHWQMEESGLHLWFDFEMGDIEFHPSATMEKQCLDAKLCGSLDNDTDLRRKIDCIVFNIGLIELISYWKCACPPSVKVCCGNLDELQTAFWRKLYWNGLGEFFYTNGIAESSETFMQLESETPTSFQTLNTLNTTNPLNPAAYLVPIGGGKDSVVTLELLRRAGKEITPLIMNPRGATVECARVAGFSMDGVLVIHRTIGKELLTLNSITETNPTGEVVHSYLNGHTPFSAMLAFYTLLASALSGIPNVALSNENSANESTVLGTNVNHQYSKSLEFENDFRDYCTNAFTHSHINAFNYFSFLRPLSELQIAMLFSQFRQYHDVFRSCNVGSKQDIWCGHCAKCLFAYIILSPFIEPQRLNAIFGKAMLDDLSLKHEYLQLLGLAETKPFECVGTVDEVRQALSMAVDRWYTEQRPALVELVPLLEPEKTETLEKISSIGNLTAEERQIIEQACIEKSN